MRLRAAAVAAPDRVLRPGVVDVAEGRIAAVDGSRAPDVAEVVDLDDCLLVPGFVDLHCHGGGGASFGGDDEQAARTIAAHLAHGTTSVMASLVTGPRDQLHRQIEALAPLVADGALLGVHLEGSWLSSAQCGAHDPGQLRAPDPSEVDELVGHDVVRMVTIAPELDGALDAVRRIVDHGAIAAIGHTDADRATARAAIAAGASHATHLFNAMRPLHHRDPGAVLALLEDDAVTLELIRDGVHVDLALAAWLDAMLPAHRLVAVTDAMAAAGTGDGRYALGALEVEVRDGRACIAGTSTIAGSTSTMDLAFAAIAGTAPGDFGLLRAAAQTSANPARVLGRADLGALAPGARADLVALDADSLEVRAVMRAGTWARRP
jgi:N-acetylglucosamine-6-phosphate deacetylase